MSKQDSYYFNSFVHLVEYSCRAAKLLKEVINNYDPSQLEQLKDQMHDIEHAADLAKHLIIEKLVKEFITPIEREDIIKITQDIDNVTDAIEDVLLRLYMYNVQSIREEFKEFADIIVQCCDGLIVATSEFQFFKQRKVSKLYEAIVEVNRLEEVGDRIYTNLVRNLFTTEKDPVNLVIWEELAYRFEKCCDVCEDVADAIEAVVMKNK
ncbi:MAG: DUF47 family protein [Bacilli bacterium]|jgi:predicted phosphate transport protein (TIGR00153 family)|nr:DUF47 family protein [Bacilli bacterium]MDY0064577.1 DUF47 family protein [Bacilli bacterium]